MAARPVLDTPVPVSFQQTIAMQVLDTIFQRVQQKTGSRFMRGFGTLWSKVSITASNEPVKYVIGRLLGGYQGVESPETGRRNLIGNPASAHLHATQRDFSRVESIHLGLNPRLPDLDVVGLHVGQSPG